MELLSYDECLHKEFQQVFVEAFSASEGPEEGVLIGNLVHELLSEQASDIFGFLATEHEKIIGGIIFSRLSFKAQISAFILSPVAIHSAYQGKGVGQALIKHGLDSLQSKGVELVFTYGDPNYYSQVRFQSISEDLIKAPQKMSMPQGWLCQSLNDNDIKPIQDRPVCVEALRPEKYW